MKKIVIFLMLFIYSFSLEIGNKVLEPEEAFKVDFIKNENSLNIKIELGKDIYLYDDKLQVNITKPKKVELLKDLKLNERSEGTGQPLITQGLLNNIVMPKPKSELIFEFEKYVNKFFVQQNFYEKENQKFEELKELLLGRMVRVEN